VTAVNQTLVPKALYGRLAFEMKHLYIYIISRVIAPPEVVDDAPLPIETKAPF